MENITWVSVPSTGHTIFVTKCGKVKRGGHQTAYFRNGKPCTARFSSREIKARRERNGYLQVALSINNKRKKYLLHRLLAEAFLPDFRPALSINHINGNKLDNRLENLECIPLADNTRHQWRTGLVNLRGEKHPQAKLTAQQVIAIRKLLALGATPNTIATIAPVTSEIIYRIRDGAAWNSVS